MASPDWIGMGDEDDGDRGCRCFQGPREERAPRYDQVRLEPDQVSRDFREPSGVALDPPVLDSNVHALVPAALPQTRPERLPQKNLVGVRGLVPQDADAVNPSRRLRACGERPRAPREPLRRHHLRRFSRRLRGSLAPRLASVLVRLIQRSQQGRHHRKGESKPSAVSHLLPQRRCDERRGRARPLYRADLNDSRPSP